MRTGPNIRKRADGRYEARYKKGRDKNGRLIYGYCYGASYEEAEIKRDAILGLSPKPQASARLLPQPVRHMGLLILGAGSQGAVVREIAETIGMFTEIAFLDDNPDNRRAIDSCANVLCYLTRFPVAIPSFGNCRLREQWAERLQQMGFLLPKLIHPAATISPTAKIAEGAVIEPRCTVSAGCIVARNAIISAGSVLGRGCVLKESVHVDCGATVSRGAIVPAYQKIPAGTVF